MAFIRRLFKKIDYIKKINTLELENESLKEEIKSGLYKKLINMSNAEIEIERLRKENKRLRQNLKELKEGFKNV